MLSLFSHFYYFVAGSGPRSCFLCHSFILIHTLTYMHTFAPSLSLLLSCIVLETTQGCSSFCVCFLFFSVFSSELRRQNWNTTSGRSSRALPSLLQPTPAPATQGSLFQIIAHRNLIQTCNNPPHPHPSDTHSLPLGMNELHLSLVSPGASLETDTHLLVLRPKSTHWIEKQISQQKRVVLR